MSTFFASALNQVMVFSCKVYYGYNPASDLTSRAQNFVDQTISLCGCRIQSYYANQSLLTAAMELRFEGGKLFKEVDSDRRDQERAYRVDAAVRKLWLLENELIQGSEARDAPMRIEGSFVTSKMPPKHLSILEKMKEFVADFEGAAYGMQMLRDKPNKEFPKADFSIEPIVQACNLSIDSQIVSVKLREIGCKFIRVLETHLDFDLIARVEVAMDQLVLYEKSIPGSTQAVCPPIYFEGTEIVPEHPFRIKNRDLKFLAVLKKAKAEVKAPTELKKVVDPRGLCRYLDLVQPILS